MHSKLTEKMEAAWEYAWGKLFCEKTNLFYDYITSRDHNKRFDHLPLPEEIAAQVPNPCGWGTGMEDSMLNAGSIADVIRLRKKLGGDADKKLEIAAEKLLDGMRLCISVHGRDGFVARSVSPRDGTSCYGNSSRDQFTLCVYGAWRLMRAFPEAESVRQEAAGILVDIARYCQKTITPENGDLLRLDGKPALVSGMVDVDVHEVMRLPMFYAAAWQASGEQHWFELYRKYATPGIEQSMHLDPNLYWWDISLSQMQLSLALLAEVEPEPELRDKYRATMRLVSDFSAKYLRIELDKAKEFPGDWDRLNDFWRLMPLRVRGELLATPCDSSMYGGYAYFLPKPPSEYYQPYSMLRAIGNLLYTVALSPDDMPAADLIEDFAAIAAQPDYPRHASGAPINMLHGYWLARDRGLFEQRL